MAKKKLTEDELKWILSIDSTEAQQSALKLDKENKQLASTNKDLKAKMTELVAAWTNLAHNGPAPEES